MPPLDRTYNVELKLPLTSENIRAFNAQVRNIVGMITGRSPDEKGYLNNYNIDIENLIIDHDNLLNNGGVGSHDIIATHMADGTIHFTEGSIDHGSISGLNDDDHTIYLLADGTRDLTGNWLTTSTNRHNFGDTGTYINQDVDGNLNIVGDTTVTLKTPTVKIGNGATSSIISQWIGGSGNGEFSWISADDRFQCEDDILMSGTERIYLTNSSNSIYSPDGNNLSLIAAVATITSSGRVINTTRYTGAGTMPDTDDEAFGDTDGGAYTINLPASPVDGQRHRVYNVGSAGNALTLGRNGNTLFGDASNFDIYDDEDFTVVFETTEGWR